MIRSTGRHTAVATLAAAALALALPGVRAQEAAGTVPATHDAAALPADLANVTHQPAAQQARWLRAAARQGSLAKLDDATLAALFAALDPLAVPEYIRLGPNGYPSYQFTMVRQERINGKWSDTPDRMLVRTTREPLRVYPRRARRRADL